jgi:hypothetical protein
MLMGTLAGSGGQLYGGADVGGPLDCGGGSNLLLGGGAASGAGLQGDWQGHVGSYFRERLAGCN